LSSFVNPANFPKDLFIVDSGGFIYLNPKIFRATLKIKTALILQHFWANSYHVCVNLHQTIRHQLYYM
jgi:hypothetical protein